MFYWMAKRFIAGENLDDALPNFKVLNGEGFSTTIDLLGESVKNKVDAEEAVRSCLLLLQALADHGIERNISIKLTQLGLDIDASFAQENLLRIVSEATRLNGFVRVDMEGTKHTQATIDMVCDVHRSLPAVGTVLQAMLRRTPADLERLMAQGIRVRLVKGAYKESEKNAYQNMDEIRAAYLNLSRILLKNGNFPAIATHDELLLTGVKKISEELGIAPHQFEFQMLYGIRQSIQLRLMQEGWGVRIYVPYGDSWMPYVMRRMRERKENVWFVVKSIFQK